MRASEEFLDRTGRIAGVGGWQVDLRTGFVHWTTHTRRIHEVDDDFQPSFPRGRSFYPPDARATLDTAIEGALLNGTPWDIELPFVTAKGRPLWVRVFGEVERVDGVPVRLMGAFQDVTEYRRHRIALLREQELRIESERHAAELHLLLKERGEMLDVMAHEIRQPLNNASAALETAATVLREQHEESASVRLLRAQTVLGQVLASIDNTLAVASLLARPDPVGLQDADVDTLLAVSIGDMLPAERGRIRIERATGTRTATMDMSLMRLALRNLLSNALRYGTPGSPVVVRVIDWDEPLALVIEVVSEGRAVAPEVVPRLFERGSKRAAGDGSQPASLGLGLYIVRRVMELHGGSSGARGQLGRSGGLPAGDHPTIGRLRRAGDRSRSDRAQRRPEHVAYPRLRLQRHDQRRGLLDAAAQPVDGRVEAVAGLPVTVLPQALAQGFARDVGAVRIDEAFHHQLIGIAEIDGGAVRRDQLARPAIELPGGRLRLARSGAALHGLDGERHLLELHGLGEVHVGPGLDHLGEHVRRKSARDHQHAGTTAQAQHLDQVDSVDPGQHEVDDVELVGVGRRVRKEPGAVVEHVDRDAPLAQVLGQELRVFGVVVDQGERSGQHGNIWRTFDFRQLNHNAATPMSGIGRKSRPPERNANK